MTQTIQHRSCAVLNYTDKYITKNKEETVDFQKERIK
jgi:hypothetical protein